VYHGLPRMVKNVLRSPNLHSSRLIDQS
jgi:hypothetical protein